MVKTISHDKNANTSDSIKMEEKKEYLLAILIDELFKSVAFVDIIADWIVDSPCDLVQRSRGRVKSNTRRAR